MEITLADILQEIKSLRGEMNKKFAEVDEKLEEQNKYIDEKLEEQNRYMSEKIKEQIEYIYKELDERFDKQSKEIAQELRTIVEYFERKDRKQTKKNQEFQKMLSENKIAHAAYDTRLYKIEVAQLNME